MKSAFIRMGCYLVGVVALFAITRGWARLQSELHHDRIVEFSAGGGDRPDGSQIRFFVGGNDLDETLAVLVHYRFPIAPNWSQLDPRIRYSSSDPIMPLRSRGKLVPYRPHNSTPDGLWIDGERWPLGDGLRVVCTTDRHEATQIELSPEEQRALVADAASPDFKGFEFFEKWILPRLPPAQPAATPAEIVEISKANAPREHLRAP